RQAERSRQFVGDELDGYLSAVWWIVGVAGWGVGELDDGVIGLGSEVGQQPPNRLDIDDELVAVQVGDFDGFEEEGELGAGRPLLDPLGEHLSGASSTFPQHGPNVQGGWDKNAQTRHGGRKSNRLAGPVTQTSAHDAPGNLRRYLRV